MLGRVHRVLLLADTAWVIRATNAEGDHLRSAPAWIRCVAHVGEMNGHRGCTGKDEPDQNIRAS